MLNILTMQNYFALFQALWALIKQMNCKDDVVIDKLLHQISHSSAWQVKKVQNGVLFYYNLLFCLSLLSENTDILFQMI